VRSSVKGSRRWVVAVLPVASAVWLFLGTTAPAYADFCESQVVHDYTKVLKRLPARPAPPLDEHLPFAPARVFFGGASYGPLQLGPGKRGFSLVFSPWTDGNSASRRVGWQVTSRLTQLDRRGRILAPPQTIEKEVKRVPAGTGLHFGFNVPGKPAIYRVEIVFENGSGKRLGRFGEYFRVLRPSLDVDFFLNGTTYRRGERVQAWLVNRGLTYLSFGLFKAIEYNDGTTWTRPPVDFPGGPVPAIGLGIGPGVKTSCWGTTIPSDAALGTYRLVTDVSQSTSPPFSRSTPVEASAEFTVTE